MSKAKAVKKEFTGKYTDIIHEVRNGVLMDVYLDGKKEVKVEVSRE